MTKRLAAGCVLLGALVLAARARAAAPACFPERTVLGTTASVYDDHGNRIGALRGQTVEVLDDRIGPGQAWAEVRITRPIDLRGRVRRDQLAVFLRRDLAILPRETWWLAGAPMQISDVDGGRVRVAPLDEGRKAHASALPTSCDRLRGRPPERLQCNDSGCEILSTPRTRGGTSVQLPAGEDLEVDIGPGMSRHVSSCFAVAISRKGARTLVDVADPQAHVRIQRWFDSSRLKPSHIGCGGASGDIESDSALGLRGGVLARSIRLLDAPDGTPFATLPSGTSYRVLELRAGKARVIARSPTWALKAFVEASGWTDAAALPRLPDPQHTAYAVRGRVVLANGLDRGVLGDLEVFEDDEDLESGDEGEAADGERSARPAHLTSVAPDGTFYLEISKPMPGGAPDRWDEPFGGGLEPVRVVARNRTGDVSGIVLDAPALPGGADEIRIVAGRSVKIAGVVESKTGARLPSVPVSINTQYSFAHRPLFHAVTAADGRFAVLVPRATFTLETGDDTYLDVDTRRPVGPLRLRLRRRPVVFGAVSRAPDGRCATDVVNAEIANEGPTRRAQFPVSPECLFVAEELPRETNSSRFWFRAEGQREVEELRSTYVSSEDDRDPEPVCLGGPCPANVVESSLMVEVADARSVMVGQAQVEVRDEQRLLGSCTASAGRCYLHHLPTGGRVRAFARAGAQSGDATLLLAPGVNELLVPTR